LADINNLSYESIIISVLSLIISASTFYWNSLRGPRIICANNRMILIARSQDGAFIGLWLTFSNIGTATGVIESLFLTLKDKQNDLIDGFIAYNEGFDPAKLDPQPATAKPMLPFAIRAGESVTKQILFTNDSFKFKKGVYQLITYQMLSTENRAKQCSIKELEIIEDFSDGEIVPNTSIQPVAENKIQIPLIETRFEFWKFV
jgi:hypothetical protein